MTGPTIQDRTSSPVPDLVMRDFTADMLNTMWCGDMTFVVGSTRRMPEAWRRISRDLAARKLHP